MTSDASVAVALPLFGRDREIRAYSLVDLEDFERVAAYRWSLLPGGYAKRTTVQPDGPRTGIVYLHRFILDLAPGETRQVDHINRIKLDNRRVNLRLVTVAQQRQNASGRHRALSPFRGVDFVTARGQWRARGQVNRVPVHIGLFATELQAAHAAQMWRREHMPYSQEVAS